MKITLLNIQYYPNVEGGAEVSTQKLAEALAVDHEVSVICHGDTLSVDKINGVTVYRMPARIKPHNKIELYFTRYYKVQCRRNLKQILEKIQPDVFHTNNLHAFTVVVWKVAHDLGIPIVHTLRDYTLLGTHHKRDTRIVKRNSLYVDAVTAPSSFTLDYFVENGLFKTCNCRKAIPNAIDYSPDAVEALSEKKINTCYEETVRFAFIGRFSKEKGIDWLISVFSEMDIDAELHLYGAGDLTEDSKELISQNANITEHGFLNQVELGYQLEDIDVVIAPSLWDEPFGRVILDGYKYGCPVIVTNNGGMPEVVDHMKTGIILDEPTDEKLRNAIEFCCDRSNIKAMIPNIRPKLEQYGIDTQREAFLNLYRWAIRKQAY